MMLSTGQIVQSVNGRILSPAPKIDCTSGRKTLASLKRLHSWLREESINECLFVGNEFGAVLFWAMNPDKMTTSDIDMANMVLFGE